MLTYAWCAAGLQVQPLLGGHLPVPLGLDGCARGDMVLANPRAPVPIPLLCIVWKRGGSGRWLNAFGLCSVILGQVWYYRENSYGGGKDVEAPGSINGAKRIAPLLLVCLYCVSCVLARVESGGGAARSDTYRSLTSNSRPIVRVSSTGGNSVGRRAVEN